MAVLYRVTYGVMNSATEWFRTYSHVVAGTRKDAEKLVVKQLKDVYDVVARPIESIDLVHPKVVSKKKGKKNVAKG